MQLLGMAFFFIGGLDMGPGSHRVEGSPDVGESVVGAIAVVGEEGEGELPERLKKKSRRKYTPAAFSTSQRVSYQAYIASSADNACTLCSIRLVTRAARLSP